jgi:hypothetical protein
MLYPATPGPWHKGQKIAGAAASVPGLHLVEAAQFILSRDSNRIEIG